MACHSHTCGHCGHRWEHPSSCMGDEDAHTCVCGRLVWARDRDWGEDAGDDEDSSFMGMVNALLAGLTVEGEE